MTRTLATPPLPLGTFDMMALDAVRPWPRVVGTPFDSGMAS